MQDCDLGQKSILHAVNTRTRLSRSINNASVCTSLAEENVEEPSKPLCETLVDLQLNQEERKNIKENDREQNKAQFFVYCTQCERLCSGKLRVRCGICKGGAFTVHRDPENWDDVLKVKRITGHCESIDIPCVV